MQQNATGSGQPAGVHFPEQLPGADIPRPPSTRPLPRVGSHNKDLSIPWSPNHPNDGYERVRTSSIGSSFRSEGIGLGRPSRSPARPSPLNPTRRGSGQHIHRKRDSSETFDASKYDFDNAFGQAEARDDAYSVAPDHIEGLTKLAQLQKKRRRTEGQRGVRQEEGHGSKMQLYPENLSFSRGEATRSPKIPSRPVVPPSLTSSATLADPLTKPPASVATQTLRSNTSSQEHSQDSMRGRNEGRAEPEELWTSVFQKEPLNKGKGKAPLSEEQYSDLEKATDERISNIRAKASPASMERAGATADQLQRRYNLFLPSLSPGQTPFNLMNVVRWRRQRFDEQIASSPSGRLSREAEIEKKSLSWRPHLSELHDLQSPRYRSRIHAPWHLTALLIEQSLQPSEPPMEQSASPLKLPSTTSPLSNNSPNRAVAMAASDMDLHSPLPERLSGGDVSAENDSNQSGGEPMSRGFGSLRRLRKSIQGPSKSVDLSPRQSPHQSRTSISSLHLFGHGGAISASNSRAHINKLFSTISPPRPVGEQSDDALSAGSANEKEGYDSSGRRKPQMLSRLSGGEQGLLSRPLSEEERSQRSSDDGQSGSGIKKRLLRPLFPRDETAVPVNYNSRSRAGSAPMSLQEKTYSPELDLMTPRPDPHKRFRLQETSPEIARTRSQEAREERRRSREEKELDLSYDQREEDCRDLEDLIKSMNEEQYQLLQLGREYMKQANELKQELHLEGFHLLKDHDFRVLTEPTSRSQMRHEELARQPDFVEKRAQSEREAEQLRAAILNGHFAPPLVPERYFESEEKLDGEFRRLTAVERDLDYVTSVATDHLKRSQRVETGLKSLKTALGGAFAHSSQVYREIIMLETLVASSRPVPTWKRISNNVKPILSWGVTILTWILKLLGEIGKIIGLFIPPLLKNQFGWEMLSGSWPRFVFGGHVVIVLFLRWNLLPHWSFETGVMALVWQVVLGYIFYGTYNFVRWYTGQLRYYVLIDWWEREGTSRSLSWSGFMRRHWNALLLLFGLVVMVFGLIYWILYPHL